MALDKLESSDVTEKVRILVLETDEPHPNTIDRLGSFGEIFRKVFSKAGEQHAPPLGVETLMTFIVEAEGGKIPDFSELEDIDAILITGSMYDADGNDEWIVKLIQWLRELWTLRPDMRFSGVCFGHQVLCRALGSRIAPTSGSTWELAHTAVNLTPIGERLFEQQGKVHLHQMHQDEVVFAPSVETSPLVPKDRPVHVWGSSEITKIQGIYIRDKLFTTQGHLGFDEEMVKLQVQQRVESGALKKDKKVEEALETAGLEHDGLVVASAILRFFHGDDSNV